MHCFDLKTWLYPQHSLTQSVGKEGMMGNASIFVVAVLFCWVFSFNLHAPVPGKLSRLFRNEAGEGFLWPGQPAIKSKFTEKVGNFMAAGPCRTERVRRMAHSPCPMFWFRVLGLNLAGIAKVRIPVMENTPSIRTRNIFLMGRGN